MTKCWTRKKPTLTELLLRETSAILRALRARQDGLVPGGRPTVRAPPFGPTGVENCAIKLTCLVGRTVRTPSMG